MAKDMRNLSLIVAEFSDALLHVDRIKAEAVLMQCLSQDDSFEQMEQIVIGSLERIGDGWEQGDISLSQVYMSGVICEGLVETYLPRYNVRRKDIPRMAIGVLLDHHSLGKRIVYHSLPFVRTNIKRVRKPARKGMPK